MSKHTRIVFALCVAVVLVAGIYGRVVHFGERPFWSDEAWVADAILSRGYGELLRQTELPLPPLFAVLGKVSSGLGFRPEIGLRLVPLIAGLLVPPLSYLILRTLRVPRSIQLAGVALSAGNTMLIVWSRELKQYGVEAFLFLALAWMVLRLRRSPRTSVPLVAAMLIVCGVGPWLGYGFVFGAVALMVVLLRLPPHRGGSRKLRPIGLLALATLALSTFVLLRTVASAQASDPGLRQFASWWFINPLAVESWLSTATNFIFTSYLIVVPQYLAAVRADQLVLPALVTGAVWLCVLIGLWSWPRRSRAEMSIIVLGPWVLLFLAAMAGRYPFGNPRLMVMWVGPLVLAMAAGLVHLCRGLSIVVMQRGGPGLVLALALSAVPLVHLMARPGRHTAWTYHDFPALLRTIDSEWRPGEPILATLMASAAVKHYAAQRQMAVTTMPASGGTCAIPGVDYDAVIRQAASTLSNRVWLLAVDGPVPDVTRDKALAILEELGFEISARPDPADHPSWGTARLWVGQRRKR